MSDPIDCVIEDLEAGFVDLVAGLRGVIRTLRDENAVLQGKLDEYRRLHRISERPAPVLPTVDSEATLDAQCARFATAQICQALDRVRGNRAQAASALGLSRTTLIYRLRALGLEDYAKTPETPADELLNEIDRRVGDIEKAAI